MGNPNMQRPVVVFAGITPAESAALPPAGLRCCALCLRCEQLGTYGGASGWALCSWQGRWEFPEAGCDRFAFDPAALGEEGLDPG
ncbi:MAG TPA: hypothetical protein VIL30_09640 [Ramlibacter sp.]